jgi:GMP synthase-like glutamine amidotransferase
VATPTRSLYVIQHTDSEFLGLIEDHLEGRGIRFTYMRPHTAKGRLPATVQFTDGLILLGGGLWGSAGSRNLPTLAEEIDLTRQCLGRGVPVIGIGLGAQILAIAAGGGSEAAEPAFTVGEASRTRADALNGFLPVRYPLVVFMRDRPLPPKDAVILAVDEVGRPALFQVGANAFGFCGHPGAKVAMIEDLAMEFGFFPGNLANGVATLRARQRELEDVLVRIMTGLVQLTGLMRSKSRRE